MRVFLKFMMSVLSEQVRYHQNPRLPSHQLNEEVQSRAWWDIPTMNNPKLMGVTFDSLHFFTPHTTVIAIKFQSRSEILKALADSSWGKDKETLLPAYKGFGRPIVS